MKLKHYQLSSFCGAINHMRKIFTISKENLHQTMSKKFFSFFLQWAPTHKHRFHNTGIKTVMSSCQLQVMLSGPTDVPTAYYESLLTLWSSKLKLIICCVLRRVQPRNWFHYSSLFSSELSWIKSASMFASIKVNILMAA